MNGIVIDTSVFVAAGFNSRSAAARIVAAVREGHFQLVWNKPTQATAGWGGCKVWVKSGHLAHQPPLPITG